MPLRIDALASDHRLLVDAAARAAGIDDPVAFLPDDYKKPLLDKAVAGPIVPIRGAMVRDWDPDLGRHEPGIRFGIRLYSIDGIPFAQTAAETDSSTWTFVTDFFVVARSDYRRLYRIACKLRRQSADNAPPPVLADDRLETLKRNTVGYLTRTNLQRIRDLGGRPRRGLLLSGPPGNGKTSACRWLWQECHRRRLEYRIVTPEMYREARASRRSADAVKRLFDVDTAGLIFFDDLDLALKDRRHGGDTDDQAVFLSALDGIEAREGVVYIFTTNCEVDAIDPAFKRPGRIDLVLQFDPPDRDLRRKLVDRWHADIHAGIDPERVVIDTADWSFAEIEEVRNLLILQHLETGRWDWEATLRQWEENRSDLASLRPGILGFHRNGHAAHA